MTREGKEALDRMARTLAEMQAILDDLARRIASLEAKRPEGQQPARREARA